VHCYETETEVTLAHLRNYLEIQRVPKSVADRYYISLAKNRKIIEGFPSKDDAYTDYFFFMALEDAVIDDLLGKVLTKWGFLGSIDITVYLFMPELIVTIFAYILYFVADLPIRFLKPCPEDLVSCYQELSARKCHWTKHLSRKRVERALRLFHGVPCPSSSESSDHRTQFFVDMQTSKPTIRVVYERKRLAAEEKRATEEKRVAAEKIGAESANVSPDATRDLEVAPEAALPTTSEPVEAGDTHVVLTNPPVEAARKAIVALPAGDKASYFQG